MIIGYDHFLDDCTIISFALNTAIQLRNNIAIHMPHNVYISNLMVIPASS